jgi:hypothetical protein
LRACEALRHEIVSIYRSPPLPRKGSGSANLNMLVESEKNF